MTPLFEGWFGLCRHENRLMLDCSAIVQEKKSCRLWQWSPPSQSWHGGADGGSFAFVAQLFVTVSGGNEILERLFGNGVLAGCAQGAFAFNGSVWLRLVTQIGCNGWIGKKEKENNVLGVAFRTTEQSCAHRKCHHRIFPRYIIPILSEVDHVLRS